MSTKKQFIDCIMSSYFLNNTPVLQTYRKMCKVWEVNEWNSIPCYKTVLRHAHQLEKKYSILRLKRLKLV